MKTLIKKRKELQKAGRWDIDFHLPAEGIKKFPAALLRRVDKVADVVKGKRDPERYPDRTFQYVDISSVDVSIGAIVNPQELEGSEAPSRARKVVRAFDVIISTCRPTRGAIAVVPPALHNQIASTGFSVLRCHDDVNPFYLHYALRLPSTLEQFRKWSTGSSYPAILDEDVAKTLLPIPSTDEQDRIARVLMSALQERGGAIRKADIVWKKTLDDIYVSLSGEHEHQTTETESAAELPLTIAEIQDTISALPALDVDNGPNDAQVSLEDLELVAAQ